MLLSLQEIGKDQVTLAGGKGANLGELTRIPGVHGPAGFCVTTDAFRLVMASVPGVDEELDRLAGLDPGDQRGIQARSAELRRVITQAAIPEDLAAAITRAVNGLGDQAAYAVRSSATAEDLPGASFAGQQDTYLNVVGAAAVVEHVRLCWASLFTERAVTYRLRGGFGQREVQLAVVVQRMVFPQGAGILFTADPVTGNREVLVIEATAGLGDALADGRVNPDRYRVRDGVIVSRETGTQPTLTGAQVTRLAQLGRRIEAHFGQPQDIEWCLADGEFQVVQSRPVTTLFPLPEGSDQGNHVYVSVGHQQMMTDAMRPLGLAFWQRTTPRRMAEAGGRLFVDVTGLLGAPGSRAGLLDTMGKHDPLMAAALREVVSRDGFIPEVPGSAPGRATPAQDPIATDPAIPAGLIERSQASLAELRKSIRGKSGPELLDFIVADIQELRRILFDPLSLQVIMAGMDAAWWLNDRLREWLGEKNAADTLAQSAPGNVTAEMGLALLDVADVIRPHPDVVAFLERVTDDSFLGGLPEVARDAIQAYLDQYGMRCAGEIDITRPRWSEHPVALVPIILGHVRNSAPGEGRRRFKLGQQQAQEKERQLLAGLEALPDGTRKSAEAKRMIDRLRTFSGYREYPKYGMISRYFIYKQALQEEAGRLVQAGVLQDREDIYYLRLDELRDVVRTGQVDQRLIRQRRDAYRAYQALTPPRVFTSDGEIITGTYQRADVPPGALAGLPVSAGTIEGRARVVLDLTEASFEPGDILVTAYTDPSWTPAFVAVSGLVTEVGGLMTHGAVIAREYGLPAVVGVEHATRLIRDGQRIRVNGTDGYVELV